MATTKLVLALLVVLAAPAAQAQDMRPGRYDYEMRMNVPGLPQGAQPIRFQQCVTPKDIADGKAFQARQPPNSDCRIEGLQRSGAEISYRMVCSKPQAMTADVKGRMSADAMDMTMDMSMQMGGQTMKMRQQMTMRRSGDC
jgi:hypothetical protein